MRHAQPNTAAGQLSGLPRTITFRSVTDVALPDPDLLAIHRACCIIAHATGAAEAAEKFNRDLEDGRIEADGSTPLGFLVDHQMVYHTHPGPAASREELVS